jgi:predicted DNA binding CopG/RHH family protein
MKTKVKKVAASDKNRWEEAAFHFEDEAAFLKLAKQSKTTTASEQRALVGPSKAKQISIRLPEEDIRAMKELADATDRPYQQLIVIAIEQYIDRVAEKLKDRENESA